MQYVEDRGRFVCVVAEFVDVRAYHVPRISIVVAREVAHVLENKVLGHVMLDDFANGEEQIASVVVKSELETRFREGLTWKAAAHHIACGYVLDRYFSDVACDGHIVIIRVHSSTLLVDIAGEYALAAQVFERLMEAAYAAKQIDECEWGCERIAHDVRTLLL
tara:strand:- start:458 stop:946 length:489 start_codon:yes stop_codon:yes gene_type:complete